MNIIATPSEARLSPDSRAVAIAAIKEQVVSVRESETYTLRPIYGDIIAAYQPISGVGKPDNLIVQTSALWEQEAIDAQQALFDAAETWRTFMEGYGFPANPDAPALMGPGGAVQEPAEPAVSIKP